MLRAIKAAPLAVRLSLAATVTVAAFALARVSSASDHQDTPEVELKQLNDINDVYAFPGANAGRIVLVLTTASPVTPAQSPTIGFDPDQLYQIKVDNTGDAVEDLVLQFRFDGEGRNQQVRMYGPVTPATAGTVNTLVDATPTLTGATNVALGSPSGIQLQAGLFDDPFFIDLEQFFKIIPDRAPVQGPLSRIRTQEATSFRSPGIDFLRGFNALGIVVELPENMLLPANAGPDPKIGIWATTSH
ncbi:MAG TPA: DUF4331 family protein [Gemmatimonadaceae bacterium]|nr:DUF4331 family protein [Gemmatimonadaceae bacterium]